MRTRTRKFEEERNNLDALVGEPPDDALSTDVGQVIPDAVSVVDTNTGATVLEWRAGASPATDPLPPVPTGTTEFATNVALVGGYIESSQFSSGSAGWRISYAGDAEFNNVEVRGRIDGIDGPDIVTNGSVEDYVELMPNGSFSLGTTTGWTGTNATLSADAVHYLGPGFSLQVNSTAGGTTSVRSTTGTGGVPVTPSTVYWPGTWIGTQVTSRTATVKVFWYKSDGSASATPSTTLGTVADLTTKFSPVVKEVTSPSDAAFAAVDVSWASCAVNEKHNLDEVTLGLPTATFNTIASPTGVSFGSYVAGHLAVLNSSATQFGTGSRSLAFVIGDGVIASDSTFTHLTTFPVSPSQYYRGTMLAKKAATVDASLMEVYIEWYTALGVSISTTHGGQVALSNNTNGLCNLTSLSPANAAFARVYGYASGTGAVFVDDITLTPVSVMTAGVLRTGDDGARVNLVGSTITLPTGDPVEVTAPTIQSAMNSSALHPAVQLSFFSGEAGNGSAGISLNAASDIADSSIDITADGAVNITGQLIVGSNGAEVTGDVLVTGNGHFTTSDPTTLTVSQGVSATEALRVETNGTGDLVSERTFQASVATTNATVTTALNLTAARIYDGMSSATDGMFAFRITVAAHRTGGAAGASGDSAAYFITGCVKHVAGTATLVGTPTITQYESVAGYDALVDVSGGGTRVRVTGVANTNITWAVTATVFPAIT